MTKTEKYITALQKRYPDIIPAHLKKSTLTDKDIAEIEQGIGYTLPKDYREFLQSFQLPKDFKVVIGFCGDAFGASFGHTYSAQTKQYVPVSNDDPAVFTEMKWHNITADNGTEFLKILRKEQYPDNDDECFPALLKAGFLKIAEFNGYMIYLDLAEGCLYTLYHEDLWEMSVVDGVDNTSIEEVREYMEDHDPLCNDFDGFLRVACLGEIFDENDGNVYSLEELNDKPEEIQNDLLFEGNPSGIEFFGIPKEAFEKGFELVPRETGMSDEETMEFLAELINISKEQCREAYEAIKREKDGRE